MRILIVDDEWPARARLRRLLSRFADIDIVGEASDGAMALTLVMELRPNVVFLDVQMPGIDGFNVAASLPDHTPAVVFVTAFDRYALRAFDAQAVDYLLKPVDPERLARTLQRLRSPARDEALSGRDVAKSLLVADRGKTHVVPHADIEWLEAADNYVKINLPGQSLLIRRTLATLLEELGSAFVRTHRSYAVAVAAVMTVQPRGKGDATVVLRSGTEVPCSRQFRDALTAHLCH